VSATVSTLLRRARPADTDRLLELIQAFYVEDGTIRFVREPLIAALGKLMGDPSLGRLWLIDADRPAVGYLVAVWGFSLEWHGRDAFVDELYVEPSSRGKGVGALHLEVERPNTRAQELYRRMGFRDHDRYLKTKILAREGGSP